MSESGFSGRYEFVLVAGAKAKTVTSLLPQPSVLASVVLFKDPCIGICIFKNHVEMIGFSQINYLKASIWLKCHLSRQYK